MLEVIPFEVHQGEEILWGDVEAFMQSFESGAEAKEYDRRIAFEWSRPEAYVKERMGYSVVIPGCV